MNLLACLNTVYRMLKTAPPRLRALGQRAVRPMHPHSLSLRISELAITDRPARRSVALRLPPFSELQHLSTHEPWGP